MVAICPPAVPPATVAAVVDEASIKTRAGPRHAGISTRVRESVLLNVSSDLSAVKGDRALSVGSGTVCVSTAIPIVGVCRALVCLGECVRGGKEAAEEEEEVEFIWNLQTEMMQGER
jgi:hypothetical protein